MRVKFARLDWYVFFLVLVLCGVGLLNIYSGTRVFSSSGVSLFTKQVIWILLGMVVFFLCCLVGSGVVEEKAWHIYFASVALLLVVLLVGKARGGARDVVWLRPDGQEMGNGDWEDRCLADGDGASVVRRPAIGDNGFLDLALNHGGHQRRQRVNQSGPGI